jgi:hypothetical protein
MLMKNRVPFLPIITGVILGLGIEDLCAALREGLEPL